MFFFLIVCLWAGIAFAQAPHFQSYSILKKNEIVRINALLQDKAGFVWMATEKGLFKFDGTKQKHFTTADSLPDENVTALAEDSSGRIWLGHRNGKLAYIEDGQVKKFIAPEGDAAGEISDIFFDAHGILWFSTHNDGIYYFMSNRLFRIDDSDGLPDLFVYDLQADLHGNVWAGTDRGVAVIHLEGNKARIKVVNEDHGLPDNIIKKVALGNKDTLWMATEDDGLLRYDAKRNTATPLFKEKWSYGTITDFFVNGHEVWIATQKTGLLVYNLTTGLLKRYGEEVLPALSSIRKLLLDQEGNVWVGHKAGLVRTYGDFVEFLEPSKQGSNNVVALTIGEDESIWYATPEGLFHRKTTPTQEVLTEKPLAYSPYKKCSVISLYTDSAGYIWAGLYGEGALRIHPQSGKIRYLNKELRNGNVLSISGNGNTVWLATLGGATEIHFFGEQLDVKNYSSVDGLETDYIYQVFQDSKKRVWFATDGKGVDCLQNSIIKHYSKGVGSKVLYGFAEDGRGNIYANVHGEGLYKWDGTAFVPMETRTQIEENTINALISDLQGNLVAAHDLGIEIYNPLADRRRYLDDEIGIRDRIPNLNAISRDARGTIYIGTDNGIMIYSDPNHRIFTQPHPYIESIGVGDELFLPHDAKELDHFRNNITIHYLGIWYQNPENLYFQYKLENHDREWVTSRNRSATYSNLPFGTYTFRVKVSETGDMKDAKEIMYRFTIKTPFWRTTLFYVLCVLAGILLIYSYIKYRERRLKEEKQLLEEKILERTLEIRRQNMEIQAQAEEIKGINEHLEELVRQRTIELERKNKALEEHAFINAHKLRGPVASLLGLIHIQLYGKMTEKETEVWAGFLMESAKRLDDIVRSITKAIEEADS